MTGEVKKIANDGTIKLELEASYYNTTSFNPIKTIKITISEDSTKIKFIDVDHDTAECNDPSISSYTTTLESVLEGAVKNPDNGNYYKVFSTKMTWEQAKAYCESVGGHLATVTSETENELCYALFEESVVSNCYLGGEDLEIDGDWNWVTGEAWEYNSFHEGEPTGKEQNVLAYWDNYGNGFWDDIASGQSAVFMCEWENKEGKRVDPSGVPASYTNWADGEPSNYKEKEHYAHFKAADGTWNDNAWTGEIICEWSNVSKILTSSRENTK